MTGWPRLAPPPLPRQGRLRPEHPALHFEGHELSYGALAMAVEALAAGLYSAGLRRGGRLAVCLPNGPPFVTLWHAAAHLGAVLVPLNTRQTQGELAWQVTHCQPSILVWAPDFANRLPALPPGLRLLTTESVTGLDGPLADAPDLGSLAAAAVAHRGPPATLEAEDPAAIVYTSGTTGRPRGVVLTHGNLVWSAVASALRLGVEAGDRWFLPLPLYHVGGLAVLVRSALAGTTVVLESRFEPERAAQALCVGGMTLASLVPTMLARVIDRWAARPVPSCLRAVLLGGGPVSVDLLRRAGALGLPVAPTYGLTEAASQVATAPPARSWPGTEVAATPLAFTALRVVDPAGIDRPRGEVGEIWVRGLTVMAGYWRDRRATSRVLRDGWLRTGDAGYLDAAGRLQLVDRRADLIVTGGENVSPAEVEAILDAHPAVAESCVVGLPDPEWGQVVVAVVVRTATVDPSALAEHARQRLAGYKVPRHFLWAATLPRTAAGKLQRAPLRQYLAGGAWSAGDDAATLSLPDRLPAWVARDPAAG